MPRLRLWLPVMVVLAVLVLVQGSPAALARPVADNAILFIGDGMGPLHPRLGEALLGQPLAMETMPYSGLAATVNMDGEVTDSAAGATALATGHKTRNGMVGVRPDGRRLESIVERARRAGKAVGVVSNDALWGATPAGFIAHAPNRGQSEDIALQVSRCGAQVMMGFGKEAFLPEKAGGTRKDGRDLVAEMRGQGYQVVFTREELMASEGKRLVGLFGDSDGPSLADMVRAALVRLERSPRGFLLVAEGAAIDWRAHGNDPAGVALETRGLSEAVAGALTYAARQGRTLVVVTADHETGGLEIAEPSRLGALRGVRMGGWEIADRLDQDRTNIAEVMAECVGIADLTPAEVAEIKGAENATAAIAAVLSRRVGVAWRTTGHTATPVKVYAFGPGAERFTGEMDNTDIPKRIARLLGLGPLPR